ncbi:hypothetical protein STRCI_007283 [Streptomyces cinnabarinus]|uniref:Uncharacterized protein n=1 Tax=Streptomyces cinnabarinus TaxID=67287 RepID=A0ABY7KQV0_9ACTN|nr:hypothetical protein [Streptomyces cinnabarinus]WAZ25767.1 hypothetical protein STRCI_007283 [Streptomyces cinnabarinus]
MNQEAASDGATAARQARFGKLPERVRFEDMTEGAETEPNGGVNASYQDVGAWRTFSCLALDLGL